MIALSEVRDWLKSFGLFDNYYVGRLDTKKNYSLGVYNLADTGRREVIGGLKKYEKKGITFIWLYYSWIVRNYLRFILVRVGLYK